MATAAVRAPVLRAYRGPQDHPAMVVISNAVRAFNGNQNVGTIADMTTYYARFDQVRLLRDCALVELDNLVVAYGRVSWEAMASGDQVVSGVLNIDPPHRGAGIESILLGHAIRRAEDLASELGHGRPVVLDIYLTSRDPQQRAAAEARGFRAVRSFAQLIRPNLDDIAEVPLPDGFDLRPIAPDDPAMHRRVWQADALAFAESWGQEAPSESDFQRWTEGETFEPTLWRVAFRGDGIAGQILNYLDQTTEPDGGRIGWTEAVSVQPEFRRRGLARALLAESLRAVREAGATKAGLGVDLQDPNQARELYESMGYRIVSIEHTYRLGPFPRHGR